MEETRKADRKADAIRRKVAAELSHWLLIQNLPDWMFENPNECSAKILLAVLLEAEEKYPNTMSYSMKCYRDNPEQLFALRSKSLREIFAPIHNNAPLRVEHVRSAARTYLNAVKDRSLYCADSDRWVTMKLSRTELEKVEREAVNCFLANWLKGDSSYSFRIRRSIKTLFASDEPHMCNEYYDRMDHVAAELEILKAMRERQRREENPKAVASPKKIGSTVRQYDLADLCGMWLLSSDGVVTPISLLRYLTRRKHLFTGTDRADSYENTVAACEDYFRILDELERWENLSKSGDLAACKKLVGGSIFLADFEESFRMFLASGMALNPKCEKIHKNADDTQRAIAIKLGGRAKSVDHRIFLRNEERDFSGQPACDILFYKEKIRCMLGPHEQMVQLADRYAYLRRMTEDVIAVLAHVYPEAARHAWTDRDFCDAAVFYRTKYRVVDELRKCTPHGAENWSNSPESRKAFSGRYTSFWRFILNLNGNTEQKAYDTYRLVRKEK